MADEPLGLPKGSIRGIVTIGTIATIIYAVATGTPLPEWYTTIAASVIAFYYGTRAGESNPQCWLGWYIMNHEDFLEHLNKNGVFEYKIGEHNKKDGVFVRNKEFDTITHFTWDAIDKHELDFLKHKTHHGRNIEKITRVTGFFSKVGSWNKGKVAELRDRKKDAGFT